MSRIIAGTYGGRRLSAPDGTRHPAHLGPRTRGAVQLPRAADLTLRAPIRRSLRRHRRGRPGGRVPGRRPCAPGRVRPPGARVLRANVEALAGRHGRHRPPVGCTSTLAGGPIGGAYDVVFADPPYAVDDEEVTAMLAGAGQHGWLAPDAVVIVERVQAARGEPDWVDGITDERSSALRRDRRFGTVADREADDAPCRVPRLVRPGHQRSPRHHRPGQPALRRGHRRRC